MFDLFRSRQKAVRILLGVLLGMVALSMLVYLIPGAGSSPVGSKDDQVLAEIGKDVLTVRDVETQIQAQMKGRQFPPEMAQILIPQKIEEMTAERASAYEAQRLGFVVTDKDLADVIRSMGQVSQMSPQQYRDFVEQQTGQSVTEFESNVRFGLYGSALESIAIQGVLATPAEVEAEYRKRNDKIKVEYIAFDPSKIAAGLKPTAADLHQFYEQKKGFFNVPASRAVQLIVADQASLVQSIQIPDSQVQAFYNAHKDQYRTPERVKARHILVMTQDKPAAEIAKLRAKADDLLKQVRAGGDFAKLAEKNSDDTNNAKNGGDLGWIVRGQMVPEFEKATFALQPKEISGIVTTNYGFHIVQVLEKEPARLQTLDEVRAPLVSGLKNQGVSERMQSLIDQARAELIKSPQSAAQIAKKLDLLYVDIPKLTQGAQIPQLGPDQQVGAAIFSLQRGQVSDVLQAGNKLAIAIVTGIQPPHPGTFDEVEAQVRSMYPDQLAAQMAADKARKAAELIKANGGDLQAAAKSVGFEVKTSDLFSRNGAVEGLGVATAFAHDFDKPVGTIMGPLGAGQDTVIAKIIDKVPADMSKLAAERDTLVNGLKSKKARERQALLRDSILTGLIQQGKVKIHKAVVDRFVARYRSTS
jgi:peptidyl-prolyl cis-trans isomerase D